MRVVLDTNTAVSALLWQGPPNQLIVRATPLALAFFSSPVLLTELEEVLGYSKLAKVVTTTGLSATELMQRYRRLVSVVEPAAIPPTVLADPDDDHVLACAVAARTELIISGDRHLLGLREYQGIPILNATEALHRVDPEKPIDKPS